MEEVTTVLKVVQVIEKVFTYASSQFNPATASPSIKPQTEGSPAKPYCLPAPSFGCKQSRRPCGEPSAGSL